MIRDEILTIFWLKKVCTSFEFGMKYIKYGSGNNFFPTELNRSPIMSDESITFYQIGHLCVSLVNFFIVLFKKYNVRKKCLKIVKRFEKKR